MKVLLAYPYKNDIYHKVGFVLPPMGIAYVASTLKDDGHNVSIKDFNVDCSYIDFSKYDVVGISMDTSRFKSGLEIAKEAKKSGSIVIAGGPHVSFRDEEALSTGLIDFVVRGEGEHSMRDLLRAIDGGNIDSVKGISYLKGSTIVRTENTEFFNNLDSLLPSRDLLRMDLYRSLEMGKRKMTSVLTSRGCPFGCSFCSSSEFSGRKWRARSPSKVVDEVEDVVNSYGFNGIAFLDDNFSLVPSRVISICDEIKRRGLDIYWWCFSRADILLRNEDMVRKMSAAGCRYIFIGFESESQSTLDDYKKGITGKMAKDVVELLREYKISTHASFIIGGVSETKDMALSTIRFAKRLNPEAVQFSILTPYPGTRLFEEVKDRIETFDWDLYDCLNPVLRCDYLSEKDLRALLKRAYISFYLSPNKIIAGLFSGLRGKGIRLGSILKILRGT